MSFATPRSFFNLEAVAAASASAADGRFLFFDLPMTTTREGGNRQEEGASGCFRGRKAEPPPHLDACFLFLVALLSIRFLVNELVVSPHDTT